MTIRVLASMPTSTSSTRVRTVSIILALAAGFLSVGASSALQPSGAVAAEASDNDIESSAVKAATGFRVSLVPGKVVPAAGRSRPGAVGTMVGYLTPFGPSWARLIVHLTASRLTSPATSIHIHLGSIDLRGPVILTLCGRVDSDVEGSCALPHHGSHMFPRNVIERMRATGAYVDLHTERSPDGELRAQLPVVRLRFDR